jgi:ABC-2 type transport system permease protein
MTPLPGFGALTRVAFRRDRIMLPAWIYVITAAVASTAYSFKKLYPTPASRQSLIVGGGGNPALRFLYGRLHGDSIGALTTWRYGVWAAIFAAGMTVFLVIRHTRGDEEAGRLELVLSGVVGRHVPLTSSLFVGSLANVVLAVLLSVVLRVLGLPLAGSAALALGVGACGLAFAGIAGAAAQLASGTRGARGLAFGVLGVAFMLRAVGDSGGPSWLSWSSPLGWVELVRPFAAERWWVLALPGGLALATVAAAFWLGARRDQGAGLVPDRPGRAVASSWLRGCLGLGWRLERGSLAAWAGGYAIIFAVCGAAAKGIDSLFGGSRGLRQEFIRLGGQAAITDAYLAALMLLAGLVTAGYAVSVVLRLRAQETGGLAEPLLATPAGRVRWAVSQLTVATAGTVLLLGVAGIATGLGYGLRGGSTGVIPMAGAALAQLPSTLVLAGVSVLLFGWMPRLSTGGAWTAVGLVVFLGLFGSALSLSHWLLDISPFTHAPRLPGGPVPAAPLVWLCAAFVALSVAGLAGLRRRDLT